MSVQLFVPSFRVDECLLEIRECLEKGWTGSGFKTLQFEDAWKEYTGLPNAHFVSSNTVGLHLAFKILKDRHQWRDGDEVITTPLTFVSTNHAIVHTGLKPVFADVDDSLCLDPESILSNITERTRAVVFVGIGGNVGQYERVRQLCDGRGIKVILDAAHMAGTRLHGRHVCGDADATVFSFQAVKNLPTADSGMVCFKHEEDDVQARKLSWLGISKDTFARTMSHGAYKWMYDVEDVGFKYHGNSIMAAIGLVQLKYLDADNAYRHQLAKWYEARLGGHQHIGLIPMAEGCESSRHLFQIRIANRDEMILILNKHDIFPGVHYRDNTEYRMYREFSGLCPQAHAASSEILSLPMHMGVTRKDVHTISDIILQYAKA
ncbi:DegT/DnrJ/EryC1/StrS family aminotransferase [Dyella flava]|uniref:DegT/DnrJ/EryC1/StrS family aminotransferase n=1 Tax=Dyella flava TaxID=1920170 RepID=A0ABS2K4X4_9GAMM|nr:DegT/DnrJ/EryC1/StrS family aminotransferase [Dyella flava]MBM7126251.1 DegT/DnrJ/EryC1/StrS family aminotransferase [Dyella flava]GLQ48944.1 spore coat protein [Dyella flava]